LSTRPTIPGASFIDITLDSFKVKDARLLQIDNTKPTLLLYGNMKIYNYNIFLNQLNYAMNNPTRIYYLYYFMTSAITDELVSSDWFRTFESNGIACVWLPAGYLLRLLVGKEEDDNLEEVIRDDIINGNIVAYRATYYIMEPIYDDIYRQENQGARYNIRYKQSKSELDIYVRAITTNLVILITIFIILLLIMIKFVFKK
jgi:hypothetical protein